MDFALDADGDIDLDKGVVSGVEYAMQKLRYRLRLWLGEWFLNVELGVPYRQYVLTKNPSQSVVDGIMKAQILSTTGVKGLLSFVSTFDKAARKYSLKAKVSTIYGTGDLVV